MSRHLISSIGMASLAIAVVAACSASPDTEEAWGRAPGAPSAQPVSIVVDANRAIHAPPGEGAGVFVEYAEGGHWRLSWTCDTNHSALPCDFHVEVSGAPLAHVTTEGFEKGDRLDVKSSSWAATATVTKSLQAVTFDTEPGASIVVYQTISGNADGSYFGWVGDGAPNGNYKGPMSDPALFLGSLR